ncbi:RagB/SusD family nutrient uptake outer membrane protein [Vaginella massiliensis]|uniref:RagB/SusD family nutrient uptake outer membrane protein n=1 Tax=Vaginella massiliensis TaxID=1816680 RepID=UPI000837DC78|nr:RagB/SusD family nutrient uptake outer membrane protein [Vaginella massiliensis]
MKAKNIFKLFFIGALLTFTSCDENDLDLKYELGDVYDTSTGHIESETKLIYVTNGIYNSVGGAGLYGAQYLIFNDVVSDNIFVSNSNDGYNVSYQNLSWSGDSDLGFLDVGYNGINQANIVINEGSLPTTDVTKSLKGEAKLLRGFLYFTLVQLYSSNPTSGQYQEFGIPLNLGIYNPNTKYSRATVAEVYDQIIKDLSEGIVEMNPNFRTTDAKTFISPLAGKLILSKVYLTRGASGDYDKAIALADEVMAAQPPITKDKLYDYFTSTNVALLEQQPETLFEINQTANYNLAVNAHISTFYSNSGSHRSLLAREAFYNQINSGDERKRLFNTSGAPVTDTPKGVWLRKWPRNTGDGNWTVNVKVLRATEAKYIKMEALAKKGDSAAALALLNEHAAERGANPYSGDAITAILADKKIEFIGEGHRFTDLKRNGLGFERETNCLSCSMPADSKYWVIPMPLSEMNRNPNMTQHPVWK